MSMGKPAALFYAAFLLAGCGYVSTPSAVHSDSDDGSTDEETFDPRPDPDIQTDDFIVEDEAEPECGNFIIETGEECDDGRNGDPRDGCTDSCKLSCLADTDCLNTNECDGEDYCNLETCECEHRNAPADGTACTDDTLSCTVDVCAAGICAHNPTNGSCAIGGACYLEGEINSLNWCQWCQSAVNPTSWTEKSMQKLGGDVRIINTDGYSQGSSIAWTGSELGVTWYDSNHSDDIDVKYFARIDSLGSNIGGAIRISDDSDNARFLSLAWTGSEFGVAWDDDRDLYWEIYFARISSSGSKIGDDVRITYASVEALAPLLVWTGSEFGLAWDDARDGDFDIYFARIDPSGLKIGSDVRITSDFSECSSLAWTGSEFGLAWNDEGGGSREIYFTRIDSFGSKIGSDMRITDASVDPCCPSLAWTGSEFGVAWEDYRDGNNNIYLALIDSTGSKIGTDIRITNDLENSNSPSLAWTGSEFGVAWSDYRDNDYEIYFASIDSSGSKIGSDVRITNTSGNSWHPSLAWTGSELGVVWEDSKDGNGELYFARIGCSP